MKGSSLTLALMVCGLIPSDTAGLYLSDAQPAARNEMPAIIARKNNSFVTPAFPGFIALAFIFMSCCWVCLV